MLRRSIAELCIDDHGHDPAALSRWVGNKTPQNVASWIQEPGSSVLLAVDGARVLAVGLVTDAGEIKLNYVAPEARFQGVSRAMVATLEARAAERGATVCTLKSTATARQFYLSHGYVEAGDPETHFGIRAYPMMKPISGGIR